VFEYNWLKADWPAAPNVFAATTLRTGGVSLAPYESWNMGLHTGDDPQHVSQNRRLLALPSEPFWLEQVHGNVVIEARKGIHTLVEADGSITTSSNTICAVMTADCLPVLLSDIAGKQVAAIHAGWRGLAAGILDTAVKRFLCGPESLVVWLGPAISGKAYEVGGEVYQAFTKTDNEADAAFKQSKPGHWRMDIYALARLRLARLGVENVYGGEVCTFSEKEKYFSYRRDGETGRMVSVIWFEKP